MLVVQTLWKQDESIYMLVSIAVQNITSGTCYCVRFLEAKLSLAPVIQHIHRFYLQAEKQ